MSRVDAWSFFRPPPTGGDPDYTLWGNRATLGVRVNGRKLSLNGAFGYAQMFGLPSRASGPGALGPGAMFFAAARNTNAYQLYFKTMSLRVQDVAPGLAIEAGRMSYESGEGTPFAGRLIGNAEWTTFERSFDGARVDIVRPSWRAHASFVMPTQGAFEESASPTLTRVQVATASWTHRTINIFAHNYRDTRRVRARPDNTGRAAAAVDVNIQTLGGSLASSFGGGFVHAWAAIQRGRWYGDRHRAASAMVEGGYKGSHRWSPAVSAGALVASGDAEPQDDAHETFFPMVPTTRPGALGGTFAQANLRDLFARVSLTPRNRLTFGGEWHALQLANARDRWYSGTGATALRGDYFGYSTRGSALARGLGTYVQAAARAAITPSWTLEATAGAMKGADVVRRQFAGEWLRVFVVENRLRLGG